MVIHSRKPFAFAAMDPVTPVEVCVADSVAVVLHMLYNLCKDLCPTGPFAEIS